MTVIYAILLFCFLIFFHELGHFAAAKFCDIKVNEFAIGMGPALLKKQKGETEYSLRAFPIGGFCAMEGEDEESSDPRGFNNKPAHQKAAVVAAGTVMNFILAIILMIIIVAVNGTATTSIGGFTKGSHGEYAGLKVGDQITSFNKTEIKEWDDVQLAVKGEKKGNKVNISVLRNEKKMTFNVPLSEESGRTLIGITPKMKRSFTHAITDGVKGTFKSAGSMYKVLKQLFTGDVSAKELSGPVGIIYIVNKSVNQGFMYFLYLMAILSINLGIVNLLPFPALDGGRLVFIVIRKITGRMITDKMEGAVNLVGLALLMLLMVYVTWNDIVKFIVPIFN